MTAVRARLFPASVVLPGQDRPWQRVAVILADDGVHVWRQPSEVADWHAEVDWERTAAPPLSRRRVGHDVHLSDGRLVVVTPGGGCSCGPLQRWPGPTWATVERV